CLLPVLGRLRCVFCGSVLPGEGTVTPSRRDSKMLVLSRKVGETLVLGGGIVVTVLEIVGGRVMVGVRAPRDIHILRGELVCRPEPQGGPPASGTRVAA